uniref:FTH domain-containing protein n=1 Tax=Panagrellus redivivus TaxID=6233 RepID=A0A7E4WBJ5_PANRE
MSSGNAIQRFTYDWLIRFAELHPIETRKTKRLKVVHYGPQHSRLAQVSPLFTTLLNRYMPIILKPYDVLYFESLPMRVRTPQGQRLTIPDKNGRIFVITKTVASYRSCRAGALTTRLSKRVYYTDVKSTFASNSSFTPYELMYLAREAVNKLQFSNCFVTEVVKFTDLWPLLRRKTTVGLDIKNLSFEKAEMAKVLLNQPSEIHISDFYVHLDLSIEKVMLFIECFLFCPQFPTRLDICFEKGYQHSSLEQIAATIKERMIASGYVWNIENGENTEISFYSTFLNSNVLQALIVRTTNKMFYVLHN